MDRAFLEQWGLTVTDADGVIEAELALSGSRAVNPLTKATLTKVSFTVMGDRLLYVGPPELVGAQPINLAFLTSATRLEDVVLQTLQDHVFQLERRSSELTAMGIHPHVDATTLQLTAVLEHPPLRVVIGANRFGQFRVLRASLDGAELTAATTIPFELSEHRDRRSLEAFVYSMFSDVAPGAAAPSSDDDGAVPFYELAAAFGDAVLPPRSGLEILATVRVGTLELRFAAARIQGRTFRGLVAGAEGKIWAERFELTDFPGVRAFIADLLQVPMDDVEVVQG